MLKQSAAHEFVRMTAAEPDSRVSTPTSFRRGEWRTYKGRPAQPSKPPPAPPKQPPAPPPGAPKPEAPQPSPPPKEGY
jgi:hypothetical protein